MDHDRKWNQAIEILQEILYNNPTANYRGSIREDGCCKEVNEIRELLITYLKSLKR